MKSTLFLLVCSLFVIGNGTKSTTPPVKPIVCRAYDRLPLSCSEYDNCKYQSNKCIFSAIPLDRVLFVGNSFTLVNNLPLVFERLAVKKNAKSYTSARGAATFNSHWHSNETRSLITGRNWSAVVLQEQSAFLSDIPQNYIPRSIVYSKQLYNLAANHTLRVNLFETWGYKNGNPNSQTGLDDNYNKMQVRLREGYETTRAALVLKKLQQKLNTSATVVYVGEAWRVAMTKGYKLHQNDEIHPTPHGTYLAACVFYATLYSESPVGLSYTIKGVSRQHARALQRIAWNTISLLRNQQQCQ